MSYPFGVEWFTLVIVLPDTLPNHEKILNEYKIDLINSTTWYRKLTYCKSGSSEMKEIVGVFTFTLIRNWNTAILQERLVYYAFIINGIFFTSMNRPKDIGLETLGNWHFWSSLDHPIRSSSPRGILVQMHHQGCRRNLPSDISALK